MPSEKMPKLDPQCKMCPANSKNMLKRVFSGAPMWCEPMRVIARFSLDVTLHKDETVLPFIGVASRYVCTRDPIVLTPDEEVVSVMRRSSLETIMTVCGPEEVREVVCNKIREAGLYSGGQDLPIITETRNHYE